MSTANGTVEQILSAGIPCPHCGKKLKPKDTKYLGKTVKCPSCQQPFLLKLPESADPPRGVSTAKPTVEKGAKPAKTLPTRLPEVARPNDSVGKVAETPVIVARKTFVKEPVSLPGSKATAPPASNRNGKTALSAGVKAKAGTPSLNEVLETPLSLADEEPLEGTGAKWVPDDEELPLSPVALTATATTTVVQPQTTLLVEKPASRRASAPFITAPDDESEASQFPVVGDENEEASSGLLSLVTIKAEDGVARLKKLRRQKDKQRKKMMALGVGGFALLVGAWWFVFQRPTPAPKPLLAQTNQTVVAFNSSKAESAPPAVEGVYSRMQLEGNPKLVDEFRPTKGGKISLELLPGGANLAFHLKPALLFSDGALYQEFRASLTINVVNWLKATIKENCLKEPEQIDDLTIAFYLGATGSKPETACVVHLKEPIKSSDLIEEFRGQILNEKSAHRVLISNKAKLGLHIKDNQTLVLCSYGLASELDSALETAAEPSDGVLHLLESTDSGRLFTMMAELGDVRRHIDDLFTPKAQLLVAQILDWFGDKTTALAWSVHVDKILHSEILLLPSKTEKSSVLKADFQRQFEQLPPLLVEAVQKMRPTTAGFRQIIGRYPAMLEAFRQATIMQVQPKHLRLVTVLPVKAAHNLALGTLLTWDESTRTDFTKQAVKAMAATLDKKLPDSVADRLKFTEIDAEIVNMPIQDAIAYIASEIKVEMNIDGDAFKDAGFTKNMRQSFNLGKVPAGKALWAMMKNYQEKNGHMAISVDEKTKSILVSTEKFLEKQGKPLFSLAPPEELKK